jgi:hypothetical protein
MDQLIIVIPDKTMTLEQYVDQGYSLFKTKGGSLIKAVKGDNGELAFMGGWQMEHNRPLATTVSFDKSNGRSYQLDYQMPLTTQKSLYMTLREHEEYSGFLQLLENSYCDLLSVKLNNTYTPGSTKQNNKNLRLLDNYNYTVFIPSTAAIEALQAKQILPSWNDLQYQYSDEEHHEYEDVVDSLCSVERWYDLKSGMKRDSVKMLVKDCMGTILNDFIRYHVMDRSVAIGMPQENGVDGNYESMKRNPQTGRFYKLSVNYDTQSMTVTDVQGNSRTVQKTEGLYNNICREYWFEGTGNNARLYMSSSAVAHLIDQPLYYETMRPWREVVAEYLRNY